MKRINEIFCSLQGEGFHSGVAAVFVRFSGCNLHCPFCDTNHSASTPMSDSEIVREINKYKVDWIILTGGEPALWIDNDFIEMLHRTTSKQVAIETNGTLSVPDSIDWITVSPKIGIAAEGDDADVKIKRADELKVVDLGQDLQQYFDLQCVGEATKLYLQPCFISDETVYRQNVKATVARVINNPKWTLSAQLHRFLNIK